MRKIYPPPFNKFVIFVFYGLLSIAVIASAQNENGGGTLMNAPDCVVDPLSPTLTNGKVIGYFPNTQPYTIDPKKIQWTLYDYINLVVNDLNSIPDNYKPAFDDLINSKNLNRATTKILLSIKNYDLTDWHGDSKFYGTLSKFGDFINNNDLDGMDIEYPGTRGYACKNAGFTWTAKQDSEFVNFVKSMKAKLAGKTIMLTVGVNLYPDYTTHPLLGLNDGTIDFLNIETYHYSLYQNEMNGVPKSNPNSPFTAFSQGHYSWNLNGTGFSNEKIIMGLDFGNTFQIVPSPNISFNQSVSLFNSDFDLPAEIKDQLKLIDDICPYPSQFASVKLYSWPWKNFSTYVLDPSTHYCNAKFGWTRKFDRTTETPWLYKQDNNLPFTYEFVSYEDISSIHFKLSNVQMGGVSISDISYDDDNNTLLNYIHGNPLPDGDLPQNPNSDKRPKTRVIVGVVLGVLFGLLILGVSFFFWRRQKKSFLKFKNAGAIPKSSMRSHTTSKNVEVSSEPRFTAPTTVIPVASGYVTAMFDFEGKEENDLSFKKGDKIEVLERGDGPNDWWVGRVNGNVGEFPGNYVKEAG